MSETPNSVSPAGSLGILVSRVVADSFGRQIRQACEAGGGAAELLVYDDPEPLAPAALERIQVALLSVDVMGNSTRAYDDPRLAAFAGVLARAPRLAWLQICAAGVDRAFYRELGARGVRLTNAAGVTSAAVAQSAVAGMLALARHLPQWIAAQREHRWQPLRGPLTPDDLSDRHAVVVGTGAIGCAIARMLRAAGMRVTGVRRSPEPLADFDRIAVFEELDGLLPETDWLVLACPLTETTSNLVDRRRLALLPATARLVNVARGAVVEEPALVDALQAGRLAGAYLDVFTVEPLPEASPLWDIPGVLVSSHSAGDCRRHQERLVTLFAHNLGAFLAGERLRNERLPTG